MNREICLKCAHKIDLHKIEIVGNYDFIEINCKGINDNEESCNCDAGFGKVAIKKEFNPMK